MRPSHPELNFRMGRGRIREVRRAFSLNGLAAAVALLAEEWPDPVVQFQRAMSARSL